MNKIKKIILTALTIFLLLPAKIYAAENLSDTYDINHLNQYTINFTNKVDGYSMQIPANMNLSFDGNQEMTRFDSDNLSIKIFIEELNRNFSYADYEVYTMKGLLNNTIDHNFTKNETIKTKFGTARIAQFSRRKLKNIYKDKNNYFILIQKLPDGRAFTLMLKSENPINQNNAIAMVNTLNIKIPKTQTAYIEKSKDLFFNENANSIEEKNWAEETKNLYINDFKKSNETIWGLFSGGAYWWSDRIKTIETAIDTNLKYQILYHSLNFKNDNVRNALQYAKRNNKMTELTFQTDILNGHNRVYDILDGQYDSFFKEMAKIIKEEQQPALFRIANEMNGDWCSYCAWNTGLDTDIYKYFYYYIYNIMETEGANPYLIYVFNPNGASFPDFKYNHESMYRPDDNKFDVLGLTLYNTGTYYPDEKWQTFDELYKPLYNYNLARYDKPYMITEFACSSIGGNKIEWTKNMLESIKNYNRIKIAIWFDGIDKDENGNNARIYKIDMPIENLNSFKNKY